MSKISVCVLCYGNHTDLARRCLDSISRYSDCGQYVADIRIALHDVCNETERYVYQWLEHAAPKDLQYKLYQPRGNILKYPTMRKMFFDEQLPLAEYTMWFDDDSYLEGNPNFWADVVRAMQTSHMIGQHWWKGFIGNMYDWILSQPWAVKTGSRPKSAVFCTGGWWTIRSELLHQFDWPAKEIRHKGGDMALGELFRHQGLTMGRFDNGVRINADANGQHSKAQRRGLSANAGPEREVGWNYTGEPLDTSHQDFEVTTTFIRSVSSSDAI